MSGRATSRRWRAGWRERGGRSPRREHHRVAHLQELDAALDLGGGGAVCAPAVALVEAAGPGVRLEDPERRAAVSPGAHGLRRRLEQAVSGPAPGDLLALVERVQLRRRL